MQITILTAGSRGDVEPLLGLAVALRDQGHHPTVVGSPDFAEPAASYGTEFESHDPGGGALNRTGGERLCIAHHRTGRGSPPCPDCRDRRERALLASPSRLPATDSSTVDALRRAGAPTTARLMDQLLRPAD